MNPMKVNLMLYKLKIRNLNQEKSKLIMNIFKKNKQTYLKTIQFLKKK